MGYKSSNALEAEENFWDQVEDIIHEADTLQVAVRKSLKVAQDNWVTLTVTEIEDAVNEVWYQIWGDYNV